MKKSERFQEKVATHPNNMLFRFSLAQALTEEGEAHNAIPHLKACADSRADWMLPRILLGKALLETGASDCAKPILEKALILAVEQDHNDPAAELRSLLADL
jgi:predicted Zn-dependent protease